MGRVARFGIYGGSFDPIHLGHLAIAEEARSLLALDQVFFVPAARQPLKQAVHGASPAHRLAMVCLACADNSAFVPSDLEISRPAPSYTVDTLASFRTQLGSAAELWFILGADAVGDLPRWHRATEMLSLARLAIVGRPGYVLDLAALEAALPGFTARIAVLDGPGLAISSTALRTRLAASLPVRYQIPDRVIDYLVAQGLYQHG